MKKSKNKKRLFSRWFEFISLPPLQLDHFFSNFIGNYADQARFELNIEKVSNDKYLKINDVESPIIDNKSKLFSYLNFLQLSPFLIQ